MSSAAPEAATLSPLTPDSTFSHAADRATLDTVAEALRRRGISAHVVGTGDQARDTVHGLIQPGAHVFNSTSATLDQIGLAQEINDGARYDAARATLDQLNPMTDGDAYRRGVAIPQVVVGSAHAITLDGQLVIASASGSQLASYAFGAAQVIWVIGAQKVVADLETALRRVQDYSYPLEDARARVAYGMPSAVNKQLIVSGDMPDRAHVVLVEEPLGF